MKHKHDTKLIGAFERRKLNIKKYTEMLSNKEQEVFILDNKELSKKDLQHKLEIAKKDVEYLQELIKKLPV